MPKKPITYEQIVRELQASGQYVPPSPLSLAGSVSEPPPPLHPADPLQLAQERGVINNAFANQGQWINPETKLQNMGKKPNPGLLEVLMSLLK